MLKISPKEQMTHLNHLNKNRIIRRLKMLLLVQIRSKSKSNKLDTMRVKKVIRLTKTVYLRLFLTKV